MVAVLSHTQVEKQLVVYADSNGREVRRDSLMKTSTVSDTSFAFVPKLAYEERSFDMVCANLDFIKEKISSLSLGTYVSVNKMSSYWEMHPIQRPGERSEMVGSEWAKEEEYFGFYDIIGAIYTSYVKR